MPVSEEDRAFALRYEKVFSLYCGVMKDAEHLRLAANREWLRSPKQTIAIRNKKRNRL